MKNRNTRQEDRTPGRVNGQQGKGSVENHQDKGKLKQEGKHGKSKKNNSLKTRGEEEIQK